MRAGGEGVQYNRKSAVIREIRGCLLLGLLKSRLLRLRSGQALDSSLRSSFGMTTRKANSEKRKAKSESRSTAARSELPWDGPARSGFARRPMLRPAL